MSAMTVIRVVGVVLIGAVLINFKGMPWGLVETAGVACLVLP